MKKYLLLFLSGMLILSSICIVVDRLIVPKIKEKKIIERSMHNLENNNDNNNNNDNSNKNNDNNNINNNETKIEIDLEDSPENVCKVFVGKFVSELNDNNFKNAYDMLATNFKKVNFPTQEDFENYWKENYNQYYVIKFIDLEIIGKAYLVNVKMDDYAHKYDSIYNAFTVIKEESGYKISFGLGE